MAAIKKGEKWYVKRKDGTTGTRGYTTQQNALNAQRTARANRTGAKPAKKTSKSSKPSKSSSPRSGGAKTAPKIGVLHKMARTILNFIAPTYGQLKRMHGHHVPLDSQLKALVDVHTGIDTLTPGGFRWMPEHAVPTWQGMAVSAGNEFWDRKLRTAARISRGKVFDIIAELIPVFSGFDASHGAPEHQKLHSFYRAWNKANTGYDLDAHDWDANRLVPYVVGKLLAAGVSKILPQSIKRSVNTMFGKKVNPL